jgi:hypothetical protein
MPRLPCHQGLTSYSGKKGHLNVKQHLNSPFTVLSSESYMLSFPAYRIYSILNLSTVGILKLSLRAKSDEAPNENGSLFPSLLRFY